MDKTVVTKINSDIILKEPHGGIRFGTDALLLADFALNGVTKGLCADLGTGSGVIPLLMLSAGCKADFLGVELQEEYCSAAAENAAANGFADRFRVQCGSVDGIRDFCRAGGCDSVVMNPPYMRLDCGRDNAEKKMSTARREVAGGAASFCKAAAYCLKSGGKLFAVYRPDRITTLLCAMRGNSIEPKRLRFVAPSVGKKPSLLLAEGIKDAAEGMIVEKQFYIYSDPDHKTCTPEMQAVYDRLG